MYNLADKKDRVRQRRHQTVYSRHMTDRGCRGHSIGYRNSQSVQHKFYCHLHLKKQKKVQEKIAREDSPSWIRVMPVKISKSTFTAHNMCVGREWAGAGGILTYVFFSLLQKNPLFDISRLFSLKTVQNSDFFSLARMTSKKRLRYTLTNGINLSKDVRSAHVQEESVRWSPQSETSIFCAARQTTDAWQPTR